MFPYWFVRLFLKLLVFIFYRKLEVVGRENVPSAGGVIFAGNHRNALVDAVLVYTKTGRRVRFAIKDTLMRSRVMRTLFYRPLGCIPIKRRQDHGSDVDNSEAFTALYEALHKGETLGIFPEGVSHNETKQSPLKRGTARIALETVARHGKSIAIVPTGLNYTQKGKIRSKASIKFGHPILVDDNWADRFRADPEKTVDQLTDRVAAELLAVTLNAPDWETLRAAYTTTRLARRKLKRLPTSTYLELNQKIVDAYTTTANDPEILHLRQQLRDYQSELDRLSIRDDHVSKNMSAFGLITRITSRILYLLILLPLALPGLIIHALPLFVIHLGHAKAPKREDIQASISMVGMTVTVPVMYGIILLGVFYFYGFFMVLVFSIVMPITGYAMVLVVEREQNAVGSLTSMLNMIRHREKVRHLKATRSDLVNRVNLAMSRSEDPALEALTVN